MWHGHAPLRPEVDEHRRVGIEHLRPGIPGRLRCRCWPCRQSPCRSCGPRGSTPWPVLLPNTPGAAEVIPGLSRCVRLFLEEPLGVDRRLAPLAGGRDGLPVDRIASRRPPRTHPPRWWSVRAPAPSRSRPRSRAGLRRARCSACGRSPRTRRRRPARCVVGLEVPHRADRRPRRRRPGSRRRRVPDDLDLGVRRTRGRAMICEARNSSRRCTIVTLRRELREEGGLLHGGVAAAHHHELAVAEEEAVARRARADPAPAQRFLAGHASHRAVAPVATISVRARHSWSPGLDEERPRRQVDVGHVHRPGSRRRTGRPASPSAPSARGP